MEVLLIRHADPDYANDTLTARGHEEAEALAESLRGVPIDDIYVSPMGRAQATMSYTAHVHRKKPVTLDWLHELDGNFDGRRWSWNVPGAEALDCPSLPGHYDWAELVAYGPHMQGAHEALGMEFDALIERYGYVKEGLRYRVAKPLDKTLACFCHAGVILSLISHLLNWPLPLVYAHVSYDPTGVTRLAWIEHDGYAVPRAKTINDLSHLHRIAAQP